ncbi:glycosyltransferase family 2 protein [Bacteroides thetaiotaomicron]|uniref:glycosyltransferase family 2 protein n=1 Tax=Bacteroides thetaiotaomicron TaxID=818 RepID=UPI004064441C
MEKKFSIIVPAYNAEEYLERCIASMANQNFPYDEYEVIVVNDGSTDGTLDLLNDLCLKYSFLRYVTTVNGGLSRARNRGIEEAVADYLLFVDSDDSIKSHSLTQIYDELIKEDLDMMLMDYLYLDSNGNPLKKPLSISGHSNRPVDGKEFLLKYKYYPMVWAYAYRRSFLLENKLEMIPIWHEDEEFTPRAIYLAQRVKYLPLVFYNYFRNKNSFMMKYNEDSYFDMIRGMESLECFRQERVVEPPLILYFQNLIAKNLLKSFKRSIQWGAPVRIQRQIIYEMKRRGFVPLPRGKRGVYLLLYKYTPIAFIYYYRLKLRRFTV